MSTTENVDMNNELVMEFNSLSICLKFWSTIKCDFISISIFAIAFHLLILHFILHFIMNFGCV